MTPDQTIALLEAAAAATSAEVGRIRTDSTAPGIHPTLECVPLSRFLTIASNGDWTQTEREHIRGCQYCLAAERKFAEPLTERFAVSEALAIPSVLATRHVVWAEPDFSWDASLLRGDSSVPATTPDNGLTGVAWHVGDEPGTDRGTLPLNPKLVSRCSDDPDIQRVAVVVSAKPLPDGSWAPIVELGPGPNRDVVVVTVIFGDETTRYFTVPPNSPGPLRPATSAPADPIPASAIRDDGPVWRGIVVIE